MRQPIRDSNTQEQNRTKKTKPHFSRAYTPIPTHVLRANADIQYIHHGIRVGRVVVGQAERARYVESKQVWCAYVLRVPV
jgi:hypothetical protein